MLLESSVTVNFFFEFLGDTVHFHQSEKFKEHRRYGLRAPWKQEILVKSLDCDNIGRERQIILIRIQTNIEKKYLSGIW